MELEQVVKRIKANNKVIITENNAITIGSAEKENRNLAVEGLNLAIDLLKGERELDGTYWGAGGDFDYAKINGVKRFQSHKSSEMMEQEIRKRGVIPVTYDSRADPYPFPKDSQNFALLKTFGDVYNVEYLRIKDDAARLEYLRKHGNAEKVYIGYRKVWDAVIYTLESGSLIVSTDEIPDNVIKSIKKIINPLEGFNGLEFRWFLGQTGTLLPRKFEFYRKQ